MRTSSIAFCLFVALAAAGAGPAAAQGKAAQPPELLMTVGIGPDKTLDSLRAFANTMQPGIGGMVTGAMLRQQVAGMATATSLDGLDDTGTIYVLAVDGGPALKGVAVVGRIADDVKLTKSVAPAHLVKKNAWAVIGPKLVAEKVAQFAFGSLAGQAIAGPPVATIYTTNLLTRYKAEIEDARKKMMTGLGSAGGQQMTGLMQAYFEGLMSAVSDSDRVIVTFEITKDVAAIDLALVPKNGTRLAKAVAVQQPADYALLAKLPATTASTVAAGRLDAGPYRAGLLELTRLMFGAGAPIAPALDAVFKASTGDFVMTMQMNGPKGMEFTQMFGVSDVKTADGALGQLFDLFKKPQTITTMGLAATHTLNPKPVMHDGVAVRALDITYDFSKVSPDTRAQMEKAFPKTGTAMRAATFDKLGLIVSSATGPTDMTAAIDAARGKGKRYTPTPLVTSFLAGSRARKESLAIVADMGAFTGTGPAGRVMMMSMGFADKRAHLRIALPAATIRGLAGGGP